MYAWFFVVMCFSPTSDQTQRQISKHPEKGCCTFREYRGHYISNPNNAPYLGEITQVYHIFALFDPPKVGNLMILEDLGNFWDAKNMYSTQKSDLTDLIQIEVMQLI